MAGEPSTEEGYHTFDERYDSITATEESARTSPEFNQVDADQNGAISKAEANQVPGLADQFPLADRNADGWVSTDEFSVLEDPSKDLKPHPAAGGT